MVLWYFALRRTKHGVPMEIAKLNSQLIEKFETINQLLREVNNQWSQHVVHAEVSKIPFYPTPEPPEKIHPVNFKGQEAIDLVKKNHPRIFQSIEELPYKKFDFITLWGVLEHINNIESTMSLLSSMLHDSGYLIITTVNAEGNIPYYYKPPEHLTYWTRESLHVLAKSIQCKVIEISDYSMFQNNDIYFNRLLSRTPEHYSKIITNYTSHLPKIMDVPTNEFIAILKNN